MPLTWLHASRLLYLSALLPLRIFFVNIISLKVLTTMWITENSTDPKFDPVTSSSEEAS